MEHDHKPKVQLPVGTLPSGIRIWVGAAKGKYPRYISPLPGTAVHVSNRWEALAVRAASWAAVVGVVLALWLVWLTVFG